MATPIELTADPAGPDEMRQEVQRQRRLRDNLDRLRKTDDRH
jgi:hypothetical protein